MRDDYDDDQPTRAEIAEQYGWREGEREQTQREMDERSRALKRDEVLQSCKAHEAERQRTQKRGGAAHMPSRNPVVERSYGQKSQDEAAAVKYWQGYIRDQLDSANRALTRAVADVVVTEERHRDQADFELRTIIIDVRDRFDEMETRLNELEARMSKRRGAATPTCDATPRGFDLDRLRSEWRH